jgi:hypothetical protein
LGQAGDLSCGGYISRFRKQSGQAHGQTIFFLTHGQDRQYVAGLLRDRVNSLFLLFRKRRVAFNFGMP